MSQKNKKKQPRPSGATGNTGAAPRSGVPAEPVRPAPASNPRPKVVAGGPRGATAVLDTSMEVEPQADASPMPAWLFVIMILLAYWAMVYFDQHAGGINELVYGPYHSYTQLADLQPKSGAETMIAQGGAIFGTYCQVCHGPAGLGTPGQYPPLAGSEWVMGTPARLIRIPNNGLQGSVTIKGQPWNANMPAIGATLSDQELAALLSFIRNSWGNKAPVITPEQVKHVRDEIGNRPRDGSAPWSSAELLKIPE